MYLLQSGSYLWNEKINSLLCCIFCQPLKALKHSLNVSGPLSMECISHSRLHFFPDLYHRCASKVLGIRKSCGLDHANSVCNAGKQERSLPHRCSPQLPSPYFIMSHSFVYFQIGAYDQQIWEKSVEQREIKVCSVCLCSCHSPASFI